MNIPIVFTHFGKSDYLEIAIQQAKFTNPKSAIYVLGDDANLYLSDFCNHQQFSKYSECDTIFKEAYQHFSTNSYEFEYFCFKRWFVLLDFMKANNLDWICAVDSDYMLYGDISAYLSTQLATMQNYTAGYCIPEQQYDSFYWSGSGHVSFISKDFLEDFCAFVIHTYKDDFFLLQQKIDYHIKNEVIGGICDMTLLYLYYIKHTDSILNLSVPFNNSVFDNNLNLGSNYSSDEYYTKKSLKDVRLIGNAPYVLSKKNEKTQFLGLHFQGMLKDRMCNFYTGKLNRIFIQLKYANFKEAIKVRLEKMR